MAAASHLLGENNRFFAPGDTLWRVDRELALLAGGGRALLMQLAHPKVAAGVADHSRFATDPLARLRRTLHAMWSIGFDEGPAALAALQRLRAVHSRVEGVIRDEAEPLAVGTSYAALDPELLFWVHATLVDSALQSYELFVGPLSALERDQYYEQSKRLAFLFGIPEASIPPSRARFTAYMDEMLAGETIAVGPTARRLATQILQPQPLPLRILGPLTTFLATGLLPERLRDQYGLAWSPRSEQGFRLAAWLVRRMLPAIPEPVRIVPNARLGERQAAFSAQSERWGAPARRASR